MIWMKRERDKGGEGREKGGEEREKRGRREGEEKRRGRERENELGYYGWSTGGLES